MYKIIKNTIISIIALFILLQPFNIKVEQSFSLEKSSSTSIEISTNKAHAENVIVKGLKPGGDQPWVIDLWRFSLSLVNVVLIGILLFLGLVNILHLNYDTYQLKKFLLPLIIAVVLANFSLFICRAINDLSFAISGQIMNNVDSIVSGIQKGLFLDPTNLIDWIARLSGAGQIAFTAASLVVMVIAIIIGSIFALVLFLVMLLLSIVLYLRAYGIFFMAGLAPIAFIFMVLPATQGLFRQWWTWFLRFTFMGPLIAIALKIASVIGTNSEYTDGLGRIVVAVIIIALMILSILVPFILGGVVFSKAGEYLSKAGGFLAKNTGWGRSISGAVKAPFERREQALASREMVAKEGTKRALDVMGTEGFNIKKMGDAYKEAGALAAEQAALETKFKATLSNKANFQSRIKDAGYLKSLNPNELSALYKAGANNGWMDAKDLAALSETAGIDDNTKNLIIQSNNEARVKGNKTPIDLSELTSSGASGATKINILSSSFENYNDSLSAAQNSPSARNKVRQATLNQIDSFMDEYGKEYSKADAKTQTTMDKQRKAAIATLNSISTDIEANTDRAGSLKSNASYQKLSKFTDVGLFESMSKTLAAKNTQARINAMQIMSSKNVLDQLPPDLKREKMQDMIIGNHTIESQMKKLKINQNNPSQVRKFFEGQAKTATSDPGKIKELTDRSIENYKFNNEQLNKYDMLHSEISTDLKTKGVIT